MFQSLAMGGGGVRGGLHVGALAAIEKVRGNLQFSEGVYGCSVGSILATAVAFNLNSKQIHDMFLQYFDLDKFIPPVRISSFTDLTSKKGLFSMDMLENTLVDAFKSQNVDIKDKMISDAPQKLYIVASNMTTQNITFFSGSVRVLDAIKCSSCIPIVFEPQILYNQVYLDGGIFVDSFVGVVPDETFILHISAPAENIFPSQLPGLSVPSFVHSIYRSMRHKPTRKNMVWLQNSTIGILQEITAKDKEHMFNEGYSQTLAFLTKLRPQELK